MEKPVLQSAQPGKTWKRWRNPVAIGVSLMAVIAIIVAVVVLVTDSDSGTAQELAPSSVPSGTGPTRLPGLPSNPNLPSLPGLPSNPNLPSLPSNPNLPGMPGAPSMPPVTTPPRTGEEKLFSQMTRHDKEVWAVREVTFTKEEKDCKIDGLRGNIASVTCNGGTYSQDVPHQGRVPSRFA